MLPSEDLLTAGGNAAPPPPPLASSCLALRAGGSAGPAVGEPAVSALGASHVTLGVLTTGSLSRTPESVGF